MEKIALHVCIGQTEVHPVFIITRVVLCCCVKCIVWLIHALCVISCFAFKSVLSLNINTQTPLSQSRSLLHSESDPTSIPAANSSSLLSCVCLSACKDLHTRIMQSLSSFLPILFSTHPLSCCRPFPHVSPLFFPHAEMGHLSLTGTQTKTGTLDSARHFPWPVHVGEQTNILPALWSACK